MACVRWWWSNASVFPYVLCTSLLRSLTLSCRKPTERIFPYTHIRN